MTNICLVLINVQLPQRRSYWRWLLASAGSLSWPYRVIKAQMPPSFGCSGILNMSSVDLGAPLVQGGQGRTWKMVVRRICVRIQDGVFVLPRAVTQLSYARWMCAGRLNAAAEM